MTKIFDKPALSGEQLITLCQKRGLNIDNQNKAHKLLQYVNYYRLSGYMIPFQEKGTHNFRTGTTLDDVICLYMFDRKLRLLIMDAVERIEIAIRSVLSNHMSIECGSHWFTSPSHFKDSFNHGEFMKKIDHAINDAGKHQTFIRHYLDKYDTPSFPPSWMLFEILDFGTLSRIYSALPLIRQKEIAKPFGFPPRIIVSWLHTLSALRNLCAHHARLWNRVFGISPKRAKELSKHFDQNDRLYSQIVVIIALLDQITGRHLWIKNLKNLLGEYPDIPRKNMGFIKNWEQTELWSIPAF